MAGVLDFGEAVVWGHQFFIYFPWDHLFVNDSSTLGMCVCVCGRWLCQIRVMCFPPFRICVLMCYFCFKFVITMVVSPPSDFICVSHPLEFVLAGVMDDLWFIGFLVSIDWRIPSIVEELFK